MGANLKVSDRGMIWNSDLVETLELQNCMINSNQIIQEQKQEKRAEVPMQEKTSKTVWMSMIILSHLMAKSLNQWKITGGSTLRPSQMVKLVKQTLNTEP